MSKKYYILLQGGLGNQLYILSYANFLKEKGVKNIKFFTTNKQKGDTKDKQKRNINTFFVEKLGFELINISPFFYRIMRYVSKLPFCTLFFSIHQEPSQEWGVFHGIPKKSSKYNVLIGYYQSHLYQSDSLIEKIKRIVNKKNTSITPNDIALHIRRGDFLTAQNTSIFSMINIEYYLKSLKIVSQKVNINKIFIFTDDPKSIEEDVKRISEKYVAEVVQGNSVFEDLQMLTQFQNYVLGNSTFAWWGAKLSQYKNPTVIVPSEPWKVEMPNKTPYPPEWTKVENK